MAAPLIRFFLTFLACAAGVQPVLAACTAELIAGPVKVRPYADLRAPRVSALLCARNEYCSFQVVITARREDCTVTDVDVSEFLRGAARIPASQITIYRQGFLNVFYRSSQQGDIGEWPDPLIPKLDPEYGEPRNAFPVEVRRISPAYKMYAQRNGRAVADGRGWGHLEASGQYAGGLVKRFIIEIVRPGRLGTATFRWRSEPGPGRFSAESVTSTAPLPLEDGVTIAFRSASRDDDFLAGDEFWVFAGPVRHQPVWVDVLVPESVPAGVFSSRVTVSVAGQRPIQLPVTIEVLNFAIPSTSSLASSFGLYWPSLHAAHYGAVRDQSRFVELGQVYARAALRNAITVTGADELLPSFQFRPDGSLAPVDFTRFDLALGPLLDGRGTPRGARLTTIQLPMFHQLTGHKLSSAIGEFARHARERGWFDRLFDYTYDEPHRGAQLEKLKRRARAVLAAEPRIPRLVTTDLTPDLVGLVTRWCPLANHLEPKATSPLRWWRNRNLPRRADYEARLRAGDSLWWYQSCESHGCGGTGRSPDDDNWPSMVVDISAAANRVFGLLSTVTYRVSGVLYWAVSFAHANFDLPKERAYNPWEVLYAFGSNGDGSLFYPGRPSDVGGTHHIAIESLRLKLIRDSFFDAEYALLLRRLGEEVFLQREVARVIRNAYRWDADPQAWLDLRDRLARRIAWRLAAPEKGHGVQPR